MPGDQTGTRTVGQKYIYVCLFGHVMNEYVSPCPECERDTKKILQCYEEAKTRRLSIWKAAK